MQPKIIKLLNFELRDMLSLSLTNILLSRIHSHEVLQVRNFNQ